MSDTSDKPTQNIEKKRISNSSSDKSIASSSNKRIKFSSEIEESSDPHAKAVNDHLYAAALLKENRIKFGEYFEERFGAIEQVESDLSNISGDTTNNPIAKPNLLTQDDSKNHTDTDITESEKGKLEEKERNHNNKFKALKRKIVSLNHQKYLFRQFISDITERLEFLKRREALIEKELEESIHCLDLCMINEYQQS